MSRQENPNPVPLRSVLILDFTNELNGLGENLIERNWLPITISSASCAMHAIQKHDIQVAVAIISANKYQNAFDAVSKLQHRAPGVKWLAIAIPDPITSLPYAHQLTTHFVDYFHCPVDWRLFAHTLGHLWGMAMLQQEADRKQLVNAQAHILVGRSKLINELKHRLKKVACSDASVLISGETGCGKGLCARLIHSLSARKDGPLVTVNCAGLPTSLIHSELFGHEKGAFTGAQTQYIGQIERADKGTLFLDEIGDLPLELQVNLLKFIDDYTIERLGGKHPIQVDCRIILASHIDLENAVTEGKFREDLYHRLNILRIHVPSLRKYREDIELLARDYLDRYSHSHRKLQLSNSALEAMLIYDWPGNVRELKNRILRALVMAEGEEITAKDLGLERESNCQDRATLARQRVEIDSEILLDTIKRNNHNIAAASRELNISRTTCYRLLKKCKIKL